MQVEVTMDYDDLTGPGPVVEDVTVPPGKSEFFLPSTHFILPKTPELPISVEIAPKDASFIEITNDNNSVTINRPVKSARPFGVIYVPIDISNDPNAPPSCAEMKAFASGSSDFVEGTFPVSSLDFIDQTMCTAHVPADATIPLSATDVDKIFLELDKMAWWNKFGKVVGVVYDGWFAATMSPHPTAAGLALAGIGWDGVFSEVCFTNGSVTAQEIAHTFTWARTYSGNQGLNCSQPGVDCYHIVNLSSPGYWANKRLKMDEIDFMHPFAGSETVVENWISRETYEFLFDHLEIPAAKGPDPILSETDVIGLSGIVNRHGGSILAPWYRLVAVPDIPLNNPGDYQVQYLDSGGGILATTAFDVNFEDHSHDELGLVEVSAYSVLVPDVTGTVRILIMHDGQPIVDRLVSENAPTSVVLGPNGGGGFDVGETMEITWDSMDQDGGELFHTVLLSIDGGENWLPVTVDRPGSAFDYVIPPDLQTDEGLIRVIATDGINTGEDISDSVFCILSGADLNADASVDAHDLILLLEDLYEGESAFDLDCEAGTGGRDLLEFSRKWKGD